MKRISVIFVLCAQDGTIPVNNHGCVLLEQASGTDVEVVVTLYSVRRVVGCADKFSFNYIETFKF